MKSNLVCCIVFFFLIICSQQCIGQKPEIKGDSVFATSEFPIQIRFPSNNIEAVFTDPAAIKVYKIDKVGASVNIQGTADTGKSFPLVVNEGKRSHTFIVCYKKNLDANNLDNVIYNYSTIKLLQQRVKQIESRELAKPAATTQASPEIAKIPALLEGGDKAFDKGRFDDAQSEFEQILKIQPGNEDATKRINKIKDTREKIVQLKSNAIKALNAEDYDAALSAFNKVLDLNPNDFFSQSQVATIQKVKNQMQAQSTDRKNDSVIYNLQSKADTAFKEKRYGDAIAAYEELSKLNPIDNTYPRKIETIKRIQTDFKENGDDNFKTLINNADKAFIDSNYEIARAGYVAASMLKPKDTSVKEKLQKTEDKLLSRKNEDDFLSAITSADMAFKNKNFEKAKTEYTKASNIFKDRTYALDKIGECNKEIELINKHRDVDKQYMLAILGADKALIDKDYVNAKSGYLQALNLKAEEVYPKNRVAQIDSIVENTQKSKDLDIKFDSAMARGDAALNKKDFNTAKTEFTLALGLRPMDEEPKTKLELIENQQNPAISKTRYDSAVTKGSEALQDQNLALALQYFKQANRIKPAEGLPIANITNIQQLIEADLRRKAENQSLAERTAREEIRKKRFQEGMAEFVNYDKAATVLNYEDELLYLKRFLNIFPDASELNDYQYTKKIEDAKIKIQQIRDHLTITKGKTYQAEAIPYLDLELERKYDAINFNTLPEGQKLDSNSATYEEYSNAAKDILSEKPAFGIADSLSNVKLSCVAIKFKKDEAFYKFLIYNKDTTEFPAGLMQMRVLKTNKDTITITPNFISSFPIVLPGKEFSIVYAAKDIPIGDQEVLVFELNDRLQKKYVKVAIPGSIYNQQKKRAL